MSADRIEKRVLLRATRERVWRAISDSREFATWFGVTFDAPFAEGARLKGRIVGTQMDEEVAAQQRQFADKVFEFLVERVEPMNRISFRWHPYALEADVDYSKEPTTLIEFELTDAVGGILLTIVESGFERIPLARRAKAFAANEAGWAKQAELIERYVSCGTQRT
jgi:uncharacterized protein YndB with AHSA1/START domain